MRTPWGTLRRVVRSRRPLVRPAAALVALALGLGAACAATRLPPVDRFEDAVLVYRDSDPEKALALAADDAGRSAWGAALGAWTLSDAKERALEACRESAQARGVEAPCRLFAAGDAPAEEIVRACAAGRAGARRCGLQKTYAPLLAR